jgi:hypothetical protein
MKKNRPTFTFRVPIDMADGTTKWLGPEGNLVDSEDLAAAFTFHRSPNGLERIEIERACHAILGDGSDNSEAVGLARWTDLNEAIEQLGQATYTMLERFLWPEGRPDIDDEARKEQDRKLFDAFSASQSSEKRRWRALRDQADRILFMARWNVLQVKVPEYFLNMAEVEMESEGVWTALELAFFVAKKSADVGKTMPSGT